MKNVQDLKINDPVWIVTDNANIKIVETKIAALSEKGISINGTNNIECDSLQNRVKLNNVQTICLNYKDAIHLAKTFCFDQISDLLKEIGNKAKKVDELSQRIQDLNDLEITAND